MDKNKKKSEESKTEKCRENQNYKTNRKENFVQLENIFSCTKL